MDPEVADIKRRITIMERMIAAFGRMAGDLDREIRIEEDRVKIHNPALVAYSTYAKAAALKCDNLRRSTDELKAQLAKTKKALLALGEVT
jgi:flagellar protein FliJ